MISHIVFPFNFLLQRLEDRIADVRNRTDAVDLTVLRHVGFAGRCELAVEVDECFGLSMVDRQTLHHDFFAVKGRHFTGLEVQAYSADMARRSVQMNGLETEISVVEGDMRQVRELFKPGSFSAVTSNPPYIKGNHGLENENSPKNIARHEILMELLDVIKAAAYLLCEGGTFAMVHKPFRLAEIIRLMSEYRIEPKRMCMVQPYADKEPNMVLIEGNKGGRTMLKVEPALVVYNRDGSYTEDLLTRYGDR